MRNYQDFTQRTPSMITIYNSDDEVLLKELSLMAINIQTNNVMAFGNDVKEQQNILEHNCIIGSPLMHGVVAEFTLTETLFKHFLKKVNPRPLFTKPIIAMRYHFGITEVEERALVDLLLMIGARGIILNGVMYDFKTSKLNIAKKLKGYKYLIEIS